MFIPAMPPMSKEEVEALRWQFTAAKLQLKNMQDAPKFVKWETETVKRQEALVAALSKICATFPKD